MTNDMMRKSINPRGFATYLFCDRYGAPCVLQKSSLATEDAVWLGVKGAFPIIMASDAIKLGLLDESVDVAQNWIEYQIPQEVVLTTQMHLTRGMASDLIKVLQQFVDTGEI